RWSPCAITSGRRSWAWTRSSTRTRSASPTRISGASANRIDERDAHARNVHGRSRVSGRRPPPPGPGRDGPWGRRPVRNDAPRQAQAPLPASNAPSELRVYGMNAVRAVFASRPTAIRKLYLASARIPQLQPLLKWCVANRIGYRVVDDEDELRRLAASTHHEGVVADVLRDPPQALSAWLQALPEGPCCALWLDGVGNPHNLGAILRSAAHFGVSAL